MPACTVCYASRVCPLSVQVHARAHEISCPRDVSQIAHRCLWPCARDVYTQHFHRRENRVCVVAFDRNAGADVRVCVQSGKFAIESTHTHQAISTPANCLTAVMIAVWKCASCWCRVIKSVIRLLRALRLFNDRPVNLLPYVYDCMLVYVLVLLRHQLGHIDNYRAHRDTHYQKSI